MIDIRKYLEDNRIKPPSGISDERFIDMVSDNMPYAYEATNDDVNAIELSIKVVTEIWLKNYSLG